MAIVREEMKIGKRTFMHTYSDAGYYIERDGIEYEDAMDPIVYEDSREYTETSRPIDII